MALHRAYLLASVVLGLWIAANPAAAQKTYDPGATDTEIKIGNIVPYSGPASAYGVNGKTIAAYFHKINADGGVNGRKINFISYDDGYSPPKRSNKRASWSKAMKFCCSSIVWERRQTPRSRDT